MFSTNSRYYGIKIATMPTASNQTVAYLQRRFLPPSEKLEVLQEHTVTQGDRLDNIHSLSRRPGTILAFV